MLQGVDTDDPSYNKQDDTTRVVLFIFPRTELQTTIALPRRCASPLLVYAQMKLHQRCHSPATWALVPENDSHLSSTFSVARRVKLTSITSETKLSEARDGAISFRFSAADSWLRARRALCISMRRNRASSLVRLSRCKKPNNRMGVPLPKWSIFSSVTI